MKLRRLWSIAKCLGWDNIPPRLLYLAKKKSGLLAYQTAPAKFDRQQFAKSVDSQTIAIADRWQSKKQQFFPLADSETLKRLTPQSTWRANVTSTCQDALNGSYPFFSCWKGDIGWPPNFNLDPVNDAQWSIADHWTRSKPSKLPQNDIKLVWEASRLSLAYTLAREFTYSKDERWATAFWDMLEAWIEQNPVNQSVAWECSQEVAFRLMAILFGTFATLDSNAATEQRLSDVIFLIWQFGKRIAVSTEYAVSQKNNHSLSEATALWTIGLLFPELAEASRWQSKGKSILAKETRRQIYDDGSYVQNSFSYHRVMLDDLIWSIQLGKINNNPLPAVVSDRLVLATKWLGKFVDQETGRVPNYGANDGANVLPLSCSDYLDYRPTLVAAESIAGLPVSKSDDHWVVEKTLWLTGKLPANTAVPNYSNWDTSPGGYHVLDSEEGRLVIRSTNHQDRPGQSDMFHIDHWYRGVNVFRDSGSYRYNHEDPELKKYFASVAAHNTVEVDGLGQMTRGPGFLWLDWPKVKCTQSSDGPAVKLECDGKFKSDRESYRHFRSVKQNKNIFEVADAVFTRPDLPRKFLVRWHLAPNVDWIELDHGRWSGVVAGKPFLIVIEGAHQIQFEKAWESLYYAEKSHHPVLIASGNSLPEKSAPTSQSQHINTTFGAKADVESHFFDRSNKL